jgi:hypothetical protein
MTIDELMKRLEALEAKMKKIFKSRNYFKKQTRAKYKLFSYICTPFFIEK